MGKRHNRRAREGLSRNERIEQLNRIYERDQGICALCLEWVRRDLASRDHIVELSEGGCNCDINLKLTHAICNKLRQHGRIDYNEVEEALSLQSLHLPHCRFYSDETDSS